VRTLTFSEGFACLHRYSVPVSNLPELVAGTQKDLQERGLISSVIGHVGDGNFHAMILYKTEEEKRLAKEAVSLMVDRAIALEGTCM